VTVSALTRPSPGGASDIRRAKWTPHLSTCAALDAHHFQVTVINKGRTEGTVSKWGLEMPGGSNLVGMKLLPGSDTPGPVAAQGRLNFYIEAEPVIQRCAQHGVGVKELIPWVQLATGKKVTGPRLP
jgi:hypothetical protein